MKMITDLCEIVGFEQIRHIRVYHVFDWINNFYLQLINLQSCNIWKQIFTDNRQLIEHKQDTITYKKHVVENADNEIFKTRF